MGSSRFGAAVPNVYGMYSAPAAARGGIKRAALSVTTSASTGTASVAFQARTILFASASSTDSGSTAPFHGTEITSISGGTVNIVTISFAATVNSVLDSGAATVAADFF